MKKFKNIAFLGAIALVGVIGFSACSSDDDPVNNGGEATGETVKTAFTLSVPNKVAGTRMATDEAGENQNSTNFSGIQDIYLFPVITGDMSTSIGGTNVLNLNSIHLSNFSNFDKADLNAKVYNDVAIPVGVDHFLFYGRRIAGTNNNGALKFDFSTITTTSNPTAINFELVPIYEKTTVSGETGATAILTALNAIDAALQTAKTSNTAVERYAENWRKMTAGSATTVAAAVSDLYASMKNLSVDGVMTAIKTYFTIDETKYDTDGTVVATWTTSNTFPRDINLPDGAVSAVYSTANKFEYLGVGVVPKSDTPDYTAVNNYVRPAELFYFTNSPVGTADKTILGSSSITLPTTWANLFDTGQDYTYSRKAVGVSTKSVILEKQIQYAVGRLELRVKVADLSGGILDHGNPDTSASDHDPQVVVVPSTGYTVTGVLIGGQKNVGWDFTSGSSTSATTDELTIYDDEIPTGIAATKGSYSTANHTLALETETDQAKRICVEFENTGNDFYGYKGEIIPAGTKFYLVAELDPTSATNYASGTLDQVFKQDYVTKVDLIIGQKSLQNAYQTIPDLRSPKLELGLSVNLEWQNGLNFEKDFK